MENPYDALERIIQTLIDVMGFERQLLHKKTLIPVVKTVFHCTIKTREALSRLLIHDAARCKSLCLYEHLLYRI